MIVNEELKNTILQGCMLDPASLHGFVVLVDGKIWKNGMNNFIFESKRQANQAFYNTMHWKCARQAARFQNSREWADNTLETWKSFKRACNFQIREI